MALRQRLRDSLRRGIRRRQRRSRSCHRIVGGFVAAAATALLPTAGQSQTVADKASAPALVSPSPTAICEARSSQTIARTPPLDPHTRPRAAAQPIRPITPIGDVAQQPVPRLDRGATQRAQELINQGIQQANRGAVYSARAQFIKVLRLVTQSLDAQVTVPRHADALAAGLRALDEAQDFRPDGSRLEADLDLERLVQSHHTPALRQADPRSLTPLVAIQTYHDYAHRQLALAGGRELVAADAYYGLAKLQPHMSVGRSEQDRYAGPVAMSFYQAALLVYPDHYLAANELGVMFARCGQLHDACDVLRLATVANPAFPETWLNLSRVHNELGEQDLARRAHIQWQRAAQLANRSPSDHGPGGRPEVTWVSPEAFARVVSETDGDPNRPISNAQHTPRRSTWPFR
jgi:hypothetical protein